MKFSEVTDTWSLSKILKNEYPDYDCHVLAMDQLKSIKPKMKQIIIINYHTSAMPGSHWLLIVCHESKYAVFFDPFANNAPEPVLKFMREYKNLKLVKDIIMTTVVVQKIEEQVCGWYCLMMAKYYIKDNMPVYEAVNAITYEDTVKYGKSMTKKYLSKMKGITED